MVSKDYQGKDTIQYMKILNYFTCLFWVKNLDFWG